MSCIQQKSIANNNMPPKPEPKKVFKFKFRGKTYAYFNKEMKKKRAEKLGISVKDITQLVKKQKLEKIAYNPQTQETKTIDISKPLLLKDFSKEKLTNAQIFSGGTDELKIFDKLPNSLNRKVVIIYDYVIKISKDTKEGTRTFEATINKNTNLQDLCEQHLLEYYSAATNIGEITITNIRVYENQLGGKLLPLTGMKLKLEKPPILKMFDNIDYTERSHCVRDLMIENYGKKYKAKNFDGMNTIDDVREWCAKKNIKCLAYDITGRIIKSYYPTKKSKDKSLIALVYANHLYPLKSCKLNRVRPLKFNDNELVFDRETFNKNLMSIINSGEIPSNIQMKNDEIISFDYKEFIIICNDNFLECKKILKEFGLYDRIKSSIDFVYCAVLIEELYVKENVNSFFPDNKRFLKGGYNYICEDETKFESKDIKTIDANKFYPSCLRELKYLYTLNILKNDLIEDLTIEEDSLYLVKPEKHSILLPNTNIYLGDHLIFCEKQGLNFEIIERIKCDKVLNYYRPMIDELVKKVDAITFKKLMNCLIGSFEMYGKTNYTVFEKFCNQDEMSRSNGLFKEIGKDLFINFKTCENHILENKKLISIQVKDLSRRKLFLKMIDEGISENNLLKIKTDSITYITETIKTKLGKGLGMWKLENTGELEQNITTIYDNEITTMRPSKLTTTNTLIHAYAGAGKTYWIKNKLIPNLNNLKFIVLSPSHSSLKEYASMKVNCEVIQKYNYSVDKLEEKIIIIDEIGMCDYFAMINIYKWAMEGKYIWALGDFNQLLPVGAKSPYNTSIFIDSIFKRKLVMDVNYRNNFTRQFYDACINGNVDKEELRKKYLNNPESNNVCCYTNDGVDKYNKIVSTRLGFDSIFDVGAKVIVNTNELRQYGIYNKFVFTVVEEEKNRIKLDNEVWLDKKTCLKKEGHKTYLSFAYARTLYSFQGESLHGLYFPEEEMKYINDRAFYTLISRLKEKVDIPEGKVKEIKNDCIIGEIVRDELINDTVDLTPIKTKETIKEELKQEQLEWKKELKKRDDYLTQVINRLRT